MIRGMESIAASLAKRGRGCFSSCHFLSSSISTDQNRQPCAYCTISTPVEAKLKSPSDSTDVFIKFVEDLCSRTTLKIAIPVPSILPTDNMNINERKVGKKIFTKLDDVPRGPKNLFKSRFSKMISQFIIEKGRYTQENVDRFSVLLEEIKKAVPEMDTEELVSTIVTMAGHFNIRDLPTLHLICDKLYACPSLTFNQLAGLCKAIADLNVDHTKLVCKLKAKFLEYLIYPMNLTQFLLIIDSFSRLRVGDEKFWTAVCQWMDEHFDSAPSDLIQRCIIPLAVSNLDSQLLEKSVARLCSYVESCTIKNPRTWLATVHTMAMLDILTPSLVTSVLNPVFQQKLASHHSKKKFMQNTLYYDQQRLVNISACARYSMKEYLPREIFEHVPSIDSNIEKYWAIKNSKVTADLVNSFRSDFYKAAPLGKVTKDPFMHDTGALLEGLLYVDVEQKKFVPLQDVGSEDSSNVKQVAVIFFTRNHLTIPEDGCKPRPIRQFPMHIRNLKLAGIHPVVFSEYDFAGIKLEAEKVDYIQLQLLSLSDNYHIHWPIEENKAAA